MDYFVNISLVYKVINSTPIFKNFHSALIVYTRLQHLSLGKFLFLEVAKIRGSNFTATIWEPLFICMQEWDKNGWAGGAGRWTLLVVIWKEPLLLIHHTANLFSHKHRSPYLF